MTRYFYQRDPKWAGIKIGLANFTAGQKGCAFFSLLQIWESLTGKTISTKHIISLVTNTWLFTDKKHPGGAGLILWDRVCEALNALYGTTIAFQGSEAGNKRANQLKALKDPKRGCLLQVNNGAHFVTLWRTVKDDAKELTVVDPWDGKLVPVFKKYHNIVGARYFVVE